jgi:hypothetical protein
MLEKICAKKYEMDTSLIEIFMNDAQIQGRGTSLVCHLCHFPGLPSVINLNQSIAGEFSFLPPPGVPHQALLSPAKPSSCLRRAALHFPFASECV